MAKKIPPIETLEDALARYKGMDNPPIETLEDALARHKEVVSDNLIKEPEEESAEMSQQDYFDDKSGAGLGKGEESLQSVDLDLATENRKTKYFLLDDGRVPVVSRRGNVTLLKEDEALLAFRSGFGAPITQEQYDQWRLNNKVDEFYAGRGVQTMFQNLLQGVVPFADWAITKFDPNYPDWRRRHAEANPNWAGVGSVGSFFVPTGAVGLAGKAVGKLGASAAAKLAAKVTKAEGAVEKAAKVGGLVGRGAGSFGAFSTAHEVSALNPGEVRLGKIVLDSAIGAVAEPLFAGAMWAGGKAGKYALGKVSKKLADTFKDENSFLALNKDFKIADKAVKVAEADLAGARVALENASTKVIKTEGGVGSLKDFLQRGIEESEAAGFGAGAAEAIDMGAMARVRAGAGRDPMASVPEKLVDAEIGAKAAADRAAAINKTKELISNELRAARTTKIEVTDQMRVLKEKVAGLKKDLQAKQIARTDAKAKLDTNQKALHSSSIAKMAPYIIGGGTGIITGVQSEKFTEGLKKGALAWFISAILFGKTSRVFAAAMINKTSGLAKKTKKAGSSLGATAERLNIKRGAEWFSKNISNKPLSDATKAALAVTIIKRDTYKEYKEALSLVDSDKILRDHYKTATGMGVDKDTAAAMSVAQKKQIELLKSVAGNRFKLSNMLNAVNHPEAVIYRFDRLESTEEDLMWLAVMTPDIYEELVRRAQDIMNNYGSEIPKKNKEHLKKLIGIVDNTLTLKIQSTYASASGGRKTDITTHQTPMEMANKTLS